MNTDSTITQGIAHFLDCVSQHLSSKTPQEKREILADLEAHIYEALASRAAGRQPTTDDLKAVLTEMDPPESYGQLAETPNAAQPSRRTLGIVALCISLGSAFLLPGVGQIIGLILGLIAWKDPFGKAAVIVAIVVLIVILGLFLFLEAGPPDTPVQHAPQCITIN